MFRRALLVALLALPALPVLAHHGWRWTDDGDFELTGRITAAELGNAHLRLGNREAAIRAYRRPLEQDMMPVDAKLAQRFREQIARVESASDPKQVPLMRNPWME